MMPGVWRHILLLTTIILVTSARTVFYPEEETMGPMPREVSIHRYPRPNSCGTAFDLYYMCYLCGRLSQARVVYEHCCMRTPVVVEFCQQVTT